jgi:hypothetical protein
MAFTKHQNKLLYEFLHFSDIYSILFGRYYVQPAKKNNKKKVKQHFLLFSNFLLKKNDSRTHIKWL